MENPNQKWRFIAGKIIYFYGLFSTAMLNNQRVNGSSYIPEGQIDSFYQPNNPQGRVPQLWLLAYKRHQPAGGVIP